MVGLGRAEPATGPGSWLTPGMAGERSVVKLTAGAACADDGRTALPAVVALAVATQQNRTKAPTNNPINTFRGCLSLKCLIVSFPLTLMWSVDCD
jgi:hypothetical protein